MDIGRHGNNGEHVQSRAVREQKRVSEHVPVCYTVVILVLETANHQQVAEHHALVGLLTIYHLTRYRK